MPVASTDIPKLPAPGRRPIFNASGRWPGRVLAGLLVLVWLPPLVSAVPAAVLQDEASPVRGRLFVPPPRSMSRALIRARAAIEAQDYRQAVELLGELLANTETEDFLIEDNPQADHARSIQLTARDLLGQVPPRWLDDYQLRYSVTARQLLERAVADADFSELARVARHFFHTPAGQSATMLLGHHDLESGRFVSARRRFEQIVSTPQARQRHDPDASLMLALCQHHTEQPDAAAETLVQLFHRTDRQTVVMFQGEPVSPLTDSVEARQWLEEWTGTPAGPGNARLDQWALFRGNAARNAASGNGFPLHQARWWIPALNDPALEIMARELFQTRKETDVPVVPSLQPLAVGNTVVVRSLNRLTGIDFRTGKRIWEFPAWIPDTWQGDSLSGIGAGPERIDESHVRERMWLDHLYGQISSNGRDVYVIDQPGYTGGKREQIILDQGRSIPDPLGRRNTNQLKCVDLFRQGAFRWEVGGDSGGSEAALAGCFFLGAPLPRNDGLLYVLGELDGEIRLLVLEQESGRLVWTQQIAAIDSVPPVEQDPVRRLAAATPSESGGILVCPTSATGLVAVEIATRSLLWGARYPDRADTDPDHQRAPAGSRSLQAVLKPPGLPDGSVDSSVTIALSRIVVMPIESDRIFSFDLPSGQQTWQDDDGLPGRPRQDGLYVACIRNRTVVVVGRETVRGLDLDSGRPQWSIPLAPYGMPAGRGFLDGDRYYLPVVSSQIVEIDVQRGEVTASRETDLVPGNLICHRGDVISQGIGSIVAWHQADPLRQHLAGLAGNELPDSRQLVLQAQLLAHDGQLDRAIELAGQVCRRGDHPVSESILCGLLLKWLTVDYPAARESARIWHDLLGERVPAEYRMARLQGAIQAGDAETALQLIAESGPGALATGRPRATATTGRDHHRRLPPAHKLKYEFARHLMESDDNPDADHGWRVSRWLETRRSQLTAGQTERLIDWVGPGAFPPAHLLDLARQQLAEGRFLDCERTLSRIPGPPDPEVASLRCQVLQASGWLAKAHELASDIARTWPEEILNDHHGPFAGREILTRWFPGQPERLTWDSWNRGVAATELQSSRQPQPLNSQMLIQPECTGISSDAPRDLKIRIDTGESRVLVLDSLGNEVGRVDFNDPEDSRGYHTTRMARGRYTLHGHLLVVGYGYELIGVDLHRVRAGDTKPLWRRTLHNETGFRESVMLQSGLGVRPVENPWGVQRFEIVGRDGNRIGVFDCNGTEVFFLVDRHLHCVDAVSGELKWQRSELTPNSRIVATPDRVFLLAPAHSDNRAARYAAVTVLDAGFGTLLNEYRLEPETGPLWQTVGTTAVFTGTEARENLLTGVDLDSGQVRWEFRCHRDGIGCLVDPHTMAIYHPDGHLDYLDLQSGQVKRRISLASVRGKSIRVMRLRDHDLVLVGRDQNTHMARSTQGNRMIRATSSLSPLFDGSLFCINLESGRHRWSTPVRVQHFSIPAWQPADLPLLYLGRIISDNTRPRSAMTAEFWLLDLRDGRLLDVFQQANLSFRTIEIHALPQQQTAELVLGDQRLVTCLTENKLPPAEPARLVDEFTMASEFSKAVPQPDDPRKRQQALLRLLMEPTAETETGTQDQ